MAYELVPDELYDKLNDIIMRHELREVYRKHPTSKIIHDILVELDKAGWVKRLSNNDPDSQEGYRMWEINILEEAEKEAFKKIERIRRKNVEYKEIIEEIEQVKRTDEEKIEKLTRKLSNTKHKEKD